MDQGTIELSQPKANWDFEKQKVVAVLSSEFQTAVRPRKAEERDILLVAKGLYEQTRGKVQPFLDLLFEDGERSYFKTLTTKAFSIHSSLNQRKGEPPPSKTYEQIIEEASNEVISNIADYYDQREWLKFKSLSEQQEPLDYKRWYWLARYEWINRFKQAQNSAINFLDQNGISRLLPKPGQDFDPKWQMATKGQDQKVSKILRGAFINKSNGKVIQEAWVETG